MAHVLRREAEAMILPDLSAFLDGRHQPRDNWERMAMMGACQFLGRHAARARLWSDAMATDPGLGAFGRVYAMPAAALAGCGVGTDAAAATEAERVRWRRQARGWFRDELAATDPGPKGGTGPAQAGMNLATWQTMSDLTVVRDPVALSRLPADEQREWTELWDRATSITGRTAGKK
jgi:serine/threonine-protein kinase